MAGVGDGAEALKLVTAVTAVVAVFGGDVMVAGEDRNR